jgi:menaquinone-dependent protoporphyrinogen oxidase
MQAKLEGMNVLVGYATAHGSTRGVAERIAAILAGRGVEVSLRPIEAGLDPMKYDILVLGSAIHNGAWLPEAVEFVETHLKDLARRPLWLFSVSSIGEESGAFPRVVRRTMFRTLKDPKGIAPFWPELTPKDHHWFAGVVTRQQWGRSGDVFMRLLLGRYGDHRNWREIDAWAEKIGAELKRTAKVAS